MKKGNLLIIDDEPQLVQSISFLMKKFAEEIYVAANGQEGFDVFKTKEVHCIICDIAMPIMTGVDLLKQIRESGSDVPFIFYTAYAQHELMLQAAKLGAYDFLKKPDFESLEEVISKGLEEGFQKGKADTPDKLLSEYDKILKELGEG